MRTRHRVLTPFLLVIFVVIGSLPVPSRAQNGRSKSTGSKPTSEISELQPPFLSCDMTGATACEPVSEKLWAFERFTVGRGTLARSYTVNYSTNRRERFRKFYSDWLATLQKLDFDSMSQDGKIDYLLFKNHLEYELRQLDIQARQLSEIEPLLPFAKPIADLEEARRRMEPIDSAKVAALLTQLRKQVDEKRRAVEMRLLAA